MNNYPESTPMEPNPRSSSRGRGPEEVERRQRIQALNDLRVKLLASPGVISVDTTFKDHLRGFSRRTSSIQSYWRLIQRANAQNSSASVSVSSCVSGSVSPCTSPRKREIAERNLTLSKAELASTSALPPPFLMRRSFPPDEDVSSGSKPWFSVRPSSMTVAGTAAGAWRRSGNGGVPTSNVRPLFLDPNEDEQQQQQHQEEDEDGVVGSNGMKPQFLLFKSPNSDSVGLVEGSSAMFSNGEGGGSFPDKTNPVRLSFCTPAPKLTKSGGYSFLLEEDPVVVAAMMDDVVDVGEISGDSDDCDLVYGIDRKTWDAPVQVERTDMISVASSSACSVGSRENAKRSAQPSTTSIPIPTTTAAAAAAVSSHTMRSSDVDRSSASCGTASPYGSTLTPAAVRLVLNDPENAEKRQLPGNTPQPADAHGAHNEDVETVAEMSSGEGSRNNNRSANMEGKDEPLHFARTIDLDSDGADSSLDFIEDDDEIVVGRSATYDNHASGTYMDPSVLASLREAIKRPSVDNGKSASSITNRNLNLNLNNNNNSNNSNSVSLVGGSATMNSTQSKLNSTSATVRIVVPVDRFERELQSARGRRKLLLAPEPMSNEASRSRSRDDTHNHTDEKNIHPLPAYMTGSKSTSFGNGSGSDAYAYHRTGDVEDQVDVFMERNSYGGDSLSDSASLPIPMEDSELPWS